ncbi:MAG: DUF3108 domain-containing protein [Candidatus Cloacimonetes bacterium]|nr:DUF3108 domain-containing protein [Candidatus Cloacimonadota bacterium]MBL7107767.1 DUF3108 domain-containing protein [Candidatus Cloacimonadota bacterium]
MKKILFLFFLFSLFGNLFSATPELPFQVGERLTFRGNFGILSGIGSSVMSFNCCDSISGHKCYHIKSVLRTSKFYDVIYKVRDEMESFWDVEKLVSRKQIKRQAEGSYKEFTTHYFYPEDTLTYFVKNRKGKTTKKQFKTLPNTQDALSIFYFLRLQNFAVGDSFYVNVTTGGENLKIQINVEKMKILDTIFGKKKCFKLVPIPVGKEIEKQTGESPIWVTADKYKIPVKLVVETIYGNFSLELIDAENVSLKIQN